MTREEAINHIKDIIYENNTVKHNNIVVFEEEKEALRVAIEALEQEPCKREIEREYLFQSLCEDFKKLQAENDDLRKRLEQEPCEDAINRQALINKAISWNKHFTDSERYVSLTDIQNAPPVNPQKPKTIQEIQAESEKYQKAFEDGYENGYAQARFDYEQEPCEDCISRQDALDCLTATGLKKYDFILNARDKIKNLPSVKPQEPILEKIRAEIEQAADKQFQIAMGIADLNERYTHIQMENAYRHCLNVIDKYRGEADCRECKTEHDCYECKKYTESEG